MTVIHRREARRTETPNGVMTTFASPSQGGSEQALWRVEMAPGARGPVHSMDSEQIWTVLDGAARVTLDDGYRTVENGDTLVLPAGIAREIAAGPAGVVAIVAGRGGALATGPGREPVVPPWIA